MTVTLKAPYTDTAAVIALAREHGDCDQPTPFALTVTVQWRRIDLFALRLKQIGCAGLRVTVRTPRPLAAVTVGHLAHARAAALELTDAVDASTLSAWFETAKAAASLGLPLIWQGSLSGDVRRHALHLPPPVNDHRWRDDWRYGTLGWRRGPGFAEVLDRRKGHRRTIVDLISVAAMFGENLDGPSFLSGTAIELIDAGFAMFYMGDVVWLPYRLRALPATASWVT